MNSAALLHNAGCSDADLQQPMHSMQEKLTAINGAMGSILTMENEFEIFAQTNVTAIWQHTLRVEYGPTARDRVEADFDL
eukprot:14752466-Alexandrium_andersonii.AAC.1